MGAQSYLQLNKHTLEHRYREKVIDLSNQLYIKNRFLVDCGIDKKECLHSLLMYQLLNKCGCEIKEYIEDKVNPKKDCKKPLAKHLHEHKEKCPTDNLCEIKQCSILIEAEW